MAVKLSQILSDINEKVRNTTTGALDNQKRVRAINRVLEDLQDFADWEFTKRTKEFFFIDRVNEYSLQNYIGATIQDNDGSTSIPDFKNPNDLRPEVASKPFEFRDIKEVRDRIRFNRNINWYAVEGDTFVVNYPRQTSAQLHNCDSLTANGNWVASGDATNLTIDTVEFSEGAGALNFDVSAGTSLIVTVPDMANVDLEQLQNKSHVTMDVWLPTITNFSSIKVEWGDDASNNWSRTETLPAGSQSLIAGKNKFAFRWNGATENGSPTVGSVNFVRVTITYSSAITETDFRIDDIRVGREVKMNLDYFSLAMVKDSTGDFQLEFNPVDVTQTDLLLGDTVAKKTVIEGSAHELFEIIGGKSERDRTDSFQKYENKKIDLLKRAGHRIRRPSKVLNFQRR
jgi:hypothetical protein